MFMNYYNMLTICLYYNNIDNMFMNYYNNVDNMFMNYYNKSCNSVVVLTYYFYIAQIRNIHINLMIKLKYMFLVCTG